MKKKTCEITCGFSWQSFIEISGLVAREWSVFVCFILWQSDFLEDQPSILNE